MKQVQRRPLFIALAVLAILGAVWSYVFLQNPPQPSLETLDTVFLLPSRCSSLYSTRWVEQPGPGMRRRGCSEGNTSLST